MPKSVSRRAAREFTDYKFPVARTIGPAACIILDKIHVYNSAETVVPIRIVCPDDSVFEARCGKIVAVLLDQPRRLFESASEDRRFRNVIYSTAQHLLLGNVSDAVCRRVIGR